MSIKMYIWLRQFPCLNSLPGYLALNYYFPSKKRLYRNEETTEASVSRVCLILATALQGRSKVF